MKPITRANFEKPHLPPEIIGNGVDEHGLIQLPTYQRVLEVARLEQTGLNKDEQAVAAPWYAHNATEDGWFPDQGRKPVHSEFAKELELSPSQGRRAISAARDNGWIEVKCSGKNDYRQVAMKATEDGLRCIEDHPEIVWNVAFVAMRIRQNLALNLWKEVVEQNRMFDAATESYQGEAMTSLAGLNRYIYDLRKQQLENLEALDDLAAADARSPTSRLST